MFLRTLYILVGSSEQPKEQTALKYILKKGGCGLDSSGSE
jgi:hypothetical protein